MNSAQQTGDYPYWIPQYPGHEPLTIRPIDYGYPNGGAGLDSKLDALIAAMNRLADALEKSGK